MQYSKHLKDIREDRDKKQEEIAMILDIKQQSYSKYERGLNMMGIDKYIILAKYYNVSLDYLAGLIDEPIKLTERKK